MKSHKVIFLAISLALQGCRTSAISSPSPSSIYIPCHSNVSIDNPPQVIFGDSITCRWPISILPAGTENAGIDGNTTTQMMERFSRDILDYHPKTLVILGGVNDLVQGIPPEIIINNLLAMANIAKDNGIRIILATIPAIKVLPVEGVNILIRQSNFEFVDYYKVTLDHPEFFIADGIHPSIAGYIAMEEALISILQY